jgi:hypothetical protein
MPMLIEFMKSLFPIFAQLVYPIPPWYPEEIMKRKQAGDRVLPADWTEVIGKVQEVLTQAEKEAAEREQALTPAKPSTPSAKRAAAWKEGLESFEERLKLFQAKVQQAEDVAAEADLALGDGEKALDDWLTRVSQVRGKVSAASAGDTAA